MDGIPLGIGLGGTMDPLEAILGPFPCIRLRNLPHEATLEDVLVFFQGLVVLDVILQGNGEAFVVFANTMDFQMALQRYVYDSFSLSRLARSCISFIFVRSTVTVRTCGEGTLKFIRGRGRTTILPLQR
jgi:hypothetical protein